MKYKNWKQKEQHLNALYVDSFTEEEAVEQFIYLTSKKRFGGRTTESHIRKCHQNRTLGSLLRRLDPTAFYTE